MQLNLTTTLIILAVILIGYAVYATQSIQKKIYCTYIRKDKTRIDKWCKQEQARIDFDGGWYYINPKRIVLITWDKGIFSVFPTKIQSLLFKWDSNQPLDPETFDNAYEKPEDRKHLDKTEDLRAMYEGNKQAVQSTKQKQGMLAGYMPIILIAGFLIVGYLVWKLQGSMDMIGNGQNVIESMLGEIMKK